MNVLGTREVELMQPTILCRDDDMLEVVVGGVKAAQAGDPSKLHRRCSRGRLKRLRRGGTSVLIPMHFVQRAIGGSNNHVLSTIVIRVVSRDAIDTATNVRNDVMLNVCQDDSSFIVWSLEQLQEIP